MADDAELVCPVDESPRLKAVKMTTKHPYKCLCRNTSRICLYSIATDIIQQVDIGSPVFCKEKKSKLTPRHLQTTSKFVLAGVVSNKRTEEIRWLKFESPIKMITATNVTIFTDFILAVMFDKN
ncbi:uncharacterized protein LOC128987382 [Macrosteles quadrilineatus]|nr:uncharacterized protein LOC128987382 [Macrosteles quadrilineatus]